MCPSHDAGEVFPEVVEVAAGRELGQLEGLELLQLQVKLVVNLEAAGTAIRQLLWNKFLSFSGRRTS